MYPGDRKRWYVQISTNDATTKDWGSVVSLRKPLDTPEHGKHVGCVVVDTWTFYHGAVRLSLHGQLLSGFIVTPSLVNG